MKVPHVEVLARHSGPESCGCYGNIAAEAFDRGSVGGLLSSEITFVDFSYGFRENRNQHKALDALYVGITSRKINWICYNGRG